MKYSIGQKVDFLWDNYDYYCNTDLVYEGTERLSGKIESCNEEKNSYGIMVGDVLYTVKEEEIINNVLKNMANAMKNCLTLCQNMMIWKTNT